MTNSAAAEALLSMLSPDELRPILSRLAEKTPGVFYYGLPLKTDLCGVPVKSTSEGDKMDVLSQALMFTAVAASDRLDLEDTMTAEFTSVMHGDRNAGSFKVEVTRIAGEKPATPILAAHATH